MISWREGETYAADFYKNRGYHIEERNFRTPRGEIDIIATRENTLVCAEVKTWRKMPLDSIEYSINRKKQRTYIQLCSSYIDMNPRFRAYYVRFDVVYINASSGQIKHIADAFMENG